VNLRDQVSTALNVLELKQRAEKINADRKAAEKETRSLLELANDEAVTARAAAKIAAAELVAAQDAQTEKEAAHKEAADEAAAAKSAADKALAEKAAAQIAVVKAEAAKAAADKEVANKEAKARALADKSKTMSIKQDAVAEAFVQLLSQDDVMAEAENPAANHALVVSAPAEKASAEKAPAKMAPIADNDGSDDDSDDDMMPAAAPIPSDQVTGRATTAICLFAQAPVTSSLRVTNCSSTAAVEEATDLTDPDDPSDDGRPAAPSGDGNGGYAAATAAPPLARTTTPPIAASAGKRKAECINVDALDDTDAELPRPKKGRSHDIMIVPRDSEHAPPARGPLKNPNKNPPVRIIGSEMRKITDAGRKRSHFDSDPQRDRIMRKAFTEFDADEISDPDQTDAKAISAHCRVLALRDGVPVGEKGDSSAMKYCGYVAKFVSATGFALKSEFVKANTLRAEGIAKRIGLDIKAAKPALKTPPEKYAQNHMAAFRLYCDLLEKERAGTINADPPPDMVDEEGEEGEESD